MVGLKLTQDKESLLDGLKLDQGGSALPVACA